jgi:uncharacterized membrane protein YqgA involved in biofilm formation
MIGTGINVMAVLLGSTIGLVAGHRVSEWFGRMVTAIIGLLTLVLGIKLACGSEDLLLLLIALLVGGAFGTGLNLEGRLARFGNFFERRWPGSGKGSIPQGFVTASLLFCVGPMAILGALRDGLFGEWQLLALKSVLDGISSVILVVGLGPGVFLAAGVVLVYQGGCCFGGFGLSVSDAQGTRCGGRGDPYRVGS